MTKPKHVCTVAPNVVPPHPVRPNQGQSRFLFKVTCSGCQWQALALDDGMAVNYKNGHEAFHAREVIELEQ